MYDVVVVGARCAGAATAMLLASEGVDVLIVDRDEFPSDTLSTHALVRGGVVQLSRWGLLDAVVESGAPPIRQVAFHLPDGELTKQVKERAGVDHLVAPRRYVLDRILLDAAREAGAQVRTGVSVTGVMTDGEGRVNGIAVRNRDGGSGRIPARFVVGADGVRSRIARAVGAAVVDERPGSGLCRYAYVAGLDFRGYEFHLGPGTFAGVFPTHDGESNVWLCTPADAASPEGGDRTEAFVNALVQAAPELGPRVRAASVVSAVRSATGLPNHILQAAGPGWALVGDAGYHRDPITGHGITDAFRDAELLAGRLAPAVLGEVPEGVAMAGYADDRAHAIAPIFDVTWRLSQFPPVDEFGALQRRLSALIEVEADWLAELPPVRRPCSTAAA